MLLGHSDGASIAAIYAGSHQDFRVRGLVLLAPHFFVEPMGVAHMAEAKRRYETEDLRERLARHHRDPDVAFRGWNDMWLAPEFRDWDVRDRLSLITAPVLGIQGDEDPYGSHVHVRSVAERAAGPVTITELACGHSPHLELPDKTATAITGFLADLP